MFNFGVEYFGFFQACIMTIALFVACEYHLCPERQSWRLVLNKIIEEHHQPTMFLTYFRFVFDFELLIYVLMPYGLLLH